MNSNPETGIFQNRIHSILNRYHKIHNLGVVLMLITATFLVSSAVNWRRIAYPTNNDYGSHVLYTQAIIDGQIDSVPVMNLSHPGIQLFLAGIHLASFQLVGLYASMMVIQVLAQIATVLILYFWFGSGTSKWWNWQRAFFSFSLTIITPITLLAINDGLYYFGYIGLANYHNPTIHLLRPLALLLFIPAVQLLEGSTASTRKVFLTAAFTTLALLVKPSYAICLLPALGILTLVKILQGERPDWRNLLVGMIAPSLIILTVQWLFTYQMANGGDSSGILLQPFAVESAFSEHLAVKFLLSILFPLAFVLFNPGMLRSKEGQLAWLGFLIGAAQMYLLAESGDRFHHGNFRWGAQITLFILFSVSAKQLILRQVQGKVIDKKEIRILLHVIYAAHVAAGIAYYIRSLLLPIYD